MRQEAKKGLHGGCGHTLKGLLPVEDPDVSGCKEGLVRRGKLQNRGKGLLKVLTEKLAATLGAGSLGARSWDQKHP